MAVVHFSACVHCDMVGLTLILNRRHAVFLVSILLLNCVCSIIGMLLGACIAFYIIIGDLSPAIISKVTGLEVCCMH